MTHFWWLKKCIRSWNSSLHLYKKKYLHFSHGLCLTFRWMGYKYLVPIAWAVWKKFHCKMLLKDSWTYWCICIMVNWVNEKGNFTAFHSSKTLQKFPISPPQAGLGGWYLLPRNGPMCPSTVNSAKNSSWKSSFCHDIILPKEKGRKISLILNKTSSKFMFSINLSLKTENITW